MTDSKPWFKDGLKFTCTECGNCCTGAPGIVRVSDEEIANIAQLLDKPLGEIKLFHTRSIPGGTSLTEFANGDCTFFDPKTRKCTIYDARPAQCKTWPFWNSNLEDKETWEAVEMICPGSGEGELVQLDEILKRASVVDI